MTKPRRQSVFRVQNHQPSLQRAFSLYDALVALTVISTVSTTAVPSFQQLIDSQRMTGAVNSLVTALNLARSETITRGKRAVLCPSTDGRSCNPGGPGGTTWETGYLLFIDLNNNHTFDADETIVRIFGATKGLRIRTTTHRDHVTYYPNGLASGSNLTFTLCSENGRGTPRAVVVSMSGRARTATRNGSGGPISCPTAA